MQLENIMQWKTNNIHKLKKKKINIHKLKKKRSKKKQPQILGLLLI